MKQIIIIVILLISTTVRAQNVENNKYIEVTGTSEREIIPDKIELLVSIRESESIKKENELLQKEKQVLAVATKFNILPADIAIDQVAAYRYGYYKTNSNRYQFSKNYRITLKDISRLDSLIMGFLDAGAHQVRITKLSHKEFERFKSQAVQEAIASARSRAEEIARSLGLTLGKAIQVKEVEPKPVTPIDPYTPSLYAQQAIYAQQVIMAEMPGDGPNIKTIQLKYGISIKFETQ